MSVKSVLSSVVGFIGHYGTEANGIAAALTNIVNALPMSKIEKAKVTEVIGKLENASENIADRVADLLAAANVDPVPVKIERKDIEEAVKAVLPALVAKAVADALAKLPPAAPAPAAAPAQGSEDKKA